MIAYHDTEWGVPVHDDRTLFEFLILEGAQAGLSWQTVLNKRDGYRKAFHSFDPNKVARMTAEDEARLRNNLAIIRNRLKIASTITNARAFLATQEEFGSFNSYLWGFVNGKTIQNNYKNLSDIPAQTQVSQTLSKELLKRGFRFVGPTICYAFMQATGMVNDHLIDCFRHTEVCTPR
jgi:DNA-3-methyladenine glycosylase I